MHRALVLIAFFLLISTSIAFRSLTFQRILDGSDSENSDSSGMIPLSGPGNFVVTVGLGTNSQGAQSSANMILALYTSQSLLANNCTGFTRYQSSEYGTLVSKNISEASFLNFNVTGSRMLAIVTLSSYWTLNVGGILATQCSTNPGVSYQQPGLSGLIGLGFANDSYDNYPGPPLFSISISQDGQSGGLLFYTNLTKATTKVPLAVLQSDENWHVSGLSTITFNSTDSRILDVSEYQVLFDLNSDAIGFPSAIYNTVIQNLEQTGKLINCTNDAYLPTCDYYGNIDNLPVMQINVGDAKIPLYPEIYIANASQYTNGEIAGHIILNIKEISSNLSGKNYISSLYNNFIVLDVHVLTYFYTVFSGNTIYSTGSISLYIADRGAELQLENGNPVLYIVMGIVILLLLVGAAYWFFVRRPKDVHAEGKEYIESRKSLLDDEGLRSQL